MRVDPICLGTFDVPLFSHGELYVTFDANNVNDCGKSLAEFSWVLVTAGGEHESIAWSEDAATAILYGSVPNLHTINHNCLPPWDLFEQHKSDTYDDAYDEDDLEDDFELEGDDFSLIDE